MPDTFAITVFFIVACAIIGAFVKGRTKDRCLRDFSGYPVTVEKNDGKVIWGRLRIENSGLELHYPEPYIDKKENQAETSYILYKNEYPRIKALIRYIDDFGPDLLKSRENQFEKTRHSRWYSRLGRKIRNFFGTVRDSFLELTDLFMGRIKSLTPVGGILEGQGKYVSQVKQQAFALAQTSYEPILERYIGKKVVLAVMAGDDKKEYAGILKDYTPEFIEIMDVVYQGTGEQEPRKADLVVPRGVGIVRHAGE